MIEIRKNKMLDVHFFHTQIHSEKNRTHTREENRDMTFARGRLICHYKTKK